MDLTKSYIPSDGVVARMIEGELVIIPISSGIGDLEDDMYTLNETGVAIWDKLAPGKSLEALIDELCREYDAEMASISQDVIGLLEELLNRKIIVCE